MIPYPWQLDLPVSAVIFDCDGTLSTIEGIDYLAEQNGVYKQVSQLTETAMAKTGLNPDLYQQRLNLVQPRHQQVIGLADVYFLHRVPDIDAVIQCLQRQQKSVYVVSAGLYPSVAGFGRLLNIPKENIFAVNVSFDNQGNYLAFDPHSPLVNNNGKHEIVAGILEKHKHAAYVGDGLNDLVVKELVSRFIGYGGSFYRQNIADQSDYYIQCPSASPLLPLLFTEAEYKQCLPEEKLLYEKGLALFQAGDGRM